MFHTFVVRGDPQRQHHQTQQRAKDQSGHGDNRENGHEGKTLFGPFPASPAIVRACDFRAYHFRA